VQAIAKLVGVADAILILGDAGKLRVQTWRASAGFSAAKDLGNQKTGALLDILARFAGRDGAFGLVAKSHDTVLHVVPVS